MTEAVIIVDGVSKRFGNKLVLDNVSIAVERSSIHGIVGNNGAGKSTLFRMLLGYERAEAGRTEILGKDSLEIRPASRARIAYVSEEHALPGWMKAGDWVATERKHYPAWDQQVFERVIGDFNVAASDRIGDISRGERAGLALAAALAKEPELLLLDEPTLGLDAVARQTFLENLTWLQEQGNCTILYCSHQMDEIERLCDSITVLASGKVTLQTTPAELAARTQQWAISASESVPDIPGLLRARALDDMIILTVLDGTDMPTGATNVSFNEAIAACLAHSAENYREQSTSTWGTENA